MEPGFLAQKRHSHWLRAWGHPVRHGIPRLTFFVQIGTISTQSTTGKFLYYRKFSTRARQTPNGFLEQLVTEHARSDH